MTKLLAVETSAEACSVCLNCEGEISVFFEHAPMRHAELLLPAVQSLLDQAGLPLADLDAIAFGRGPGGFTSLRIGIGVIQGLAWGAGLPVVPVSSLAAVAQDAFELTEGSAQSVCVAMDARMNEVYTGSFHCTAGEVVEADGEERVCPPGEIAAPAPGSFIAAGNGFDRFDELQSLGQKAIACHAGIWPRAEVVARLALKWMESHEPLAAGLAQPVYVRNQVATKTSQR